jgi:MerR family mercuric resistance operon transcriptional regulator
VFTIGQAARESGVKIETIRYYERRALVPPPARSASGRRRYDSGDVARLRFVKRCRNLGFGLEPIGEMLDLIDGKTAECDAIHLIATTNLQKVRQRIAELAAMEQALAAMVQGCKSGQDTCPMARRLLEGE